MNNARLIARMQALSRLAGIGVIGIGGFVILGWLFNISPLKSGLPGSATMKFNTALCFILSGVILLRLRSGSSRFLLVLSVIVTTIGFLTLLEYLFRWNLGIDQWLVHETLDVGQPAFPGRMSMITAFNLCLIGISLLFTIRSRRPELAQVLALGAMLTTVLSVVSYMYDVPALYQISTLSTMSLPTTITLLVLNLAILFVHAEHGLVAMIITDRAGGLLARRLLPAAIIIPLIIGWLRLQGQRTGLFEMDSGQVFFTWSNMILFSTIVLWTTGLLNRLDSQRSQAIAALHQANEQLEGQIQKRTAQLIKSEELLQQSEAKFSTAFRASPAAISIATLPDGRWIEINEALAKMVGYSSEELIGHSSAEFGLVDDVARARIVEAIRTQGRVRDVEIQMHTKSQGIVDVLMSAEQIEINGEACALTIQYDITELKRARTALQASEERYRALFDNSPIGISIGRNTTRMFVNPAFVRMFGYEDMSEIVNGSALDQVAPQCREEIMERLRTAPPPATQSVTFESLGQRKDGSIFPVLIQLASLELVDGVARVIFVNDITERKRAEDALRENEQKLQTFFDMLPVGVSVMNQDGKIIEMNPALEKMMEMSREGLASGAYNSRKYIGSDGRPVSPSDFPSTRALIEQQTVHDMEIGVIKEDQTVLWTSVSAAPLPLAHSGAIVVTADITERKLAERRFQALLESAPDAMVVVNQQGHIVLVNSQTERLFGYLREELIGKAVEVLIPGRYHSLHPVQREEYVDHPSIRNISHGLELYALRKDGSEFPVEISLSPIETEAGTLIASAIRDITERKRVQQSLAQLAAIVESSDDAIIGKTLEGTIVSWNAAAKRIFGYSADEIIGKSINVLFPPERLHEEPFIMDRLIQGEPIEDFETVRLTKDGRRIPVSLTISPIKNARGGIIGASKIARDITERKQVERQLAAQAEELARSNQELEQFAYIASHDLQEPLRMVTSYMGLLSRRYAGKLDEKADKYIAFAVDGATRMQQLINDLLTYSRVGSHEPDFSNTDLEKVLATVLQNLRIAVKESQAQITHDTLPVITADKNQLTQLFQNLIGNAIKFHGKAVPQVHISAQQQESQWIFAVHDNGIGIESEYHEQVFEIFKRLHTRTEYSGTGLGLAICKKIVEQHRGRIWLDSEPGKGSTFYFSLPIRRIDP